MKYDFHEIQKHPINKYLLIANWDDIRLNFLFLYCFITSTKLSADAGKITNNI